MADARLTAEDVAALTALASGIIPADAADGGALAVNAGPRLAARVESGINANLYSQGLEMAVAMAKEKHRCAVSRL
jgi:hypothetical protein